MRTVLSLVLVFLFVCVANAQPPQDGRGKFGMGRGQFGDPAKMAEIRKNMRQRWQSEKPEINLPPGPPPWAGKGMRRGPGGPQSPFLGPCPRGVCPRTGVELRGSGPKNKVSPNHSYYRGRGWKFDNKYNETKRGGTKGQKSRSNNKGSKVIIINIG